jgi:adenylate cyclase
MPRMMTAFFDIDARRAPCGRRGFMTLSVLVLLSGLFPVAAQEPGRLPATLAVLPLENNSGDGTQDYFASGLTDEIGTALANVRGLAVVARSSAFQLKPPDREPQAAGRALNAQYLVKGTARLAGERVQLAIGLVRASDGASLWSESFDGPSIGIFDVQEAIARKVATALDVPAGAMPALVRSRTRDLAPYLDFLRAKVAARPRGAALGNAAPALEQVVQREPDFAPATALLAYAYSLTPLFSPALRAGQYEEERKVVERTVPRGHALAQRAVMLDPRNAEAFVALGYTFMVQRRMAEAEDAFKQAIALNPNQADGLHGYSQLIAALGRVKESLAMREHLQLGEQFIINYTADTAEIYWLDGDTAKAVAMLQPFRPGRTLELAIVLAASGRYQEAAVALREMPATNYPPGMLEAAAKILESAPARAASPEGLPRIGNLSFAHLHVGAPERVLDFYEDEVRGNYFQPISATWFWHPTYEPVRRTERFKAIARDLGFVDYWRARGWPPQCRAMGASDFVCD